MNRLMSKKNFLLSKVKRFAVVVAAAPCYYHFVHFEFVLSFAVQFCSAQLVARDFDGIHFVRKFALL
jgi:hypothetical protein